MKYLPCIISGQQKKGTMYFLITLCVLVASTTAGYVPLPTYTYANPYPAVYTLPYTGQKQYLVQNNYGQYSYGFASGDGITKGEARSIDGSVAGSYSYTAPEGQKIHVTYTAGEEGFKPIGDLIPQPIQPIAEIKTAEQQEGEKSQVESNAGEETEEKKTVLVAPTPYAYPYTYYHSYPYGYNFPYAYKFPITAYKTVVQPVVEVKATPQQSYSYSFTS